MAQFKGREGIVTAIMVISWGLKRKRKLCYVQPIDSVRNVVVHPHTKQK